MRNILSPRKLPIAAASATTATALIVLANAAFAEAPYMASPKKITDKQGLLSVIVDLSEGTEDAFPAVLESLDADKERVHNPKVVNLVREFEKTYGFAKKGMTSWVGNSFTAFLTQKQIDLIRKDKRVKLVSENGIEEFSAPPPWNDQIISSLETASWGRVATNGKTKTAAINRSIYVIDSGVGYHDDLTNVTQRTNVSCGASGACTPPVVGCYAHSMHIAGIISAAANNNKTSVGVYAGANIRSLSVVDSGAYIECANGPVTTAAIGYALDHVRMSTPVNAMVPVVNISMNGGSMGWRLVNGIPTAETNHSKVVSLVTPRILDAGRRYNGAFVVQSAGNASGDVCSVTTAPSLAYRPNPSLYSAARADDGVMVIGAISSNGAAITPANPFPATDPPGLTGQPSPSNYGACVDAWAPGSNILSTWGFNTSYPHTDTLITYSGSPPSITGWGYISGTSMAAPHVVGAAAYLADTFWGYSWGSPSGMEVLVRQYLVSTGASDPVGLPIKIVQLP